MPLCGPGVGGWGCGMGGGGGNDLDGITWWKMDYDLSKFSGRNISFG